MTTVETREAPAATNGGSPRDQKSGFEINGEHYSIPTLDTITLDEERVLYIYADTVLQDFSPAHPEMSEQDQRTYDIVQMGKIRNPDFKRALAHIAYKRKHPEVSDSEINKSIGMANALEVDLAMIRGDDDDPPAPSSQKQPESKSDTNGHLKLAASGSPTESSSDRADESPESIGTSESATSSPGAAPTESVS